MSNKKLKQNLHKSLHKIIDASDASLSIYVKNMDTDTVLFQHNIHQKMRSASIIKLFILGACAAAFNSGTLTKETQLSVTQKDKVPFSLISELSTDTWRIDDIAALMITLSDNTATNLLIDQIGVKTINEYINSLDMPSTILQRKMMDFKSAQAGLDNYTSLVDSALLLEMIYKKTLIGPSESDWMYDVLSNQKNKTMLGRFLPETIEMAHKTGLNDAIQHDIGFININGSKYLVGVFVDGEANEIKGFECIGTVAKQIYVEVQNDI